MKTSGILLEEIVVRVKAWDTLVTLRPTTKVRDIKHRDGVWHFAAQELSSTWPGRRTQVTWTSVSTKHDLRKALGMTPERRK